MPLHTAIEEVPGEAAVKENYDDPINTSLNTVRVEFVCRSITSSNLTEIATFGQGVDTIPRPNVDPSVFAAVAQTSNPYYVYFNSDSHGYNIMEVTPESLACTMVAVSTIKQPTAQKSVLKRFRVPVDLVEIIDETPVVAPSSAGV